MPRAKKPTASAAAAAPAPQPMPPQPMGALPGQFPQAGPGVPTGFPATPPTGFGPPPGYAQPMAPAPAAPTGAPQVIDTAAVMAAAQQATETPNFQFPAMAPLPTVAPPSNELASAGQVLPQILVKLDQVAGAMNQNHGQVLEAVGKAGQARVAEHQEVKALLTTVMDHLGGIGELVTKLAQTLQIVPQQAPAPATQAQLAPQQQPPFQPAAPAAPQAVQPATAAGVPALKNPNWGQEGLRDFARRTAQLCAGHPWTQFVAQMYQAIPQTALSQDDMCEFLRAYRLVTEQGYLVS